MIKFTKLILIFILIFVPIIGVFSFYKLHMSSTLTTVDKIDTLYISNKFPSQHKLNKTFIHTNEAYKLSEIPIEALFNEIVLPFNPQENLILTTPETNKLDYTLKMSIDHNIYVQLVYNPNIKKISLIIPKYTFSLGNQEITTQEIEMYNYEGVEKQDILSLNNKLISLNMYNNNFSIKLADLSKSAIKIFRNFDQNLLANGNYSFENHNEVEARNCSESMEGKPDFIASISSDGTDGAKSLKLKSNNHFACYREIYNFENLNQKENIYKFTFDYKSDIGSKARYFVNYGYNEFRYGDMNYFNLEKSGDFGSLLKSDILWQNEEYLFIPDKEFNTFSYHFYAPSQGEQLDVSYDNVRLYRYNMIDEKSFSLDTLPTSVDLVDNVQLQGGEFEINFSKDENLIIDQNSSFDLGPWTKSVEDCSQHLPNLPEFDMSIYDFDFRKNVLNLASSNHHACTSNTFSIDLQNDYYYDLSFDYKNLLGNKVKYLFSIISKEKENYFDDNLVERFKNNKSILSEELIIDNQNWHTLTKTINSNIEDVFAVQVYLYSPSDGISTIRNLFDELKINKSYPKNMSNFYLYSQLDNNTNSKYEEINIREDVWGNKKMEIKTNKTVIFIYDQNRFNDRHGLFYNNKKINQKVKFNNFSNGWVIDTHKLCQMDTSVCYIDEEGNMNLFFDYSYSLI